MNKSTKKKVYNWETIELTEKQLLGACLQAFNEVPNKRLKNNDTFPNTYAIASAIGTYLENTLEGQ